MNGLEHSLRSFLNGLAEELAILRSQPWRSRFPDEFVERDFVDICRYRVHTLLDLALHLSLSSEQWEGARLFSRWPIALNLEERTSLAELMQPPSQPLQDRLKALSNLARFQEAPSRLSFFDGVLRALSVPWTMERLVFAHLIRGGEVSSRGWVPGSIQRFNVWTVRESIARAGADHAIADSHLDFVDGLVQVRWLWDGLEQTLPSELTEKEVDAFWLAVAGCKPLDVEYALSSEGGVATNA